jgi:molybdenum cofactor cytidylyltransferase
MAAHRTGSITAILLAAGESTRMGVQKALLPWHGTTLIAYQVEQLLAVPEIAEIIVVTGHEPARITEIARRCERTIVAHTAAYATGKVSSIKRGLEAVSDQADGVLLLAVDQPRPAEVLRAIVSAHVASGAAITAPVHGGRRGHPVVFAKALREELARIEEATLGVRGVMDRHAGEIQEIAIEDPAVLVDLNTMEDVERAR